MPGILARISHQSSEADAVAHALLRAASALMPTPRFDTASLGEQGVETSLDTARKSAQCHLVFLPSLDGKAVAAAPHLSWVGPAFGAPGKSASGHQVDHPVKFLLLLLD